MRKILFVAVLVLICGCFAVAQDYPKAELGAGWNYLHFDEGSGGTQNGIPGGFFIDGTYYFVKVLGLAGDFQYNKKTFSGDANFTAGDQARALSFHAGPRVKARMGKFEPFAHALFGVTDVSFTPAGGTSSSDHAFSMKLGGGLDVAMAHHFALRLGEFNYYLTKFGTGTSFNGQDHQNNFTFGVGVVLR
ncbi:MAG: outer membrane beta-barrel protein [Terriglobales bacterium]